MKQLNYFTIVLMVLSSLVSVNAQTHTAASVKHDSQIEKKKAVNIISKSGPGKIYTVPKENSTFSESLVIDGTYNLRFENVKKEFMAKESITIKPGVIISNGSNIVFRISDKKKIDKDRIDALMLFESFPNPVENTLSLHAKSKIQSVTVHNMLGQEVITKLPNTLNDDLDMSALNSGTYFVKVIINNTTETIKIVKK